MAVPQDQNLDHVFVAAFSEKDESFSPLLTDSEDSMVDESEQSVRLDYKDEEGALLPAPGSRSSKLIFWVVVNVVTTIAIVFINKSIFRSPAFNDAQFLFGSYHFLLTHAVLSLLSSPHPLLLPIRQFHRASIPIRSLLPLAASMSLSVIFLNTSLQFCSVPFYQTVRVLLTPIVAGINYLFFAKAIPRQAAVCIIPMCAGVALLAYSDTKSRAGNTTSLFGATVALVGVVISSVYTVWIKTYQETLEVKAHQLLHAQSLLGGAMLGVLGLATRKIPLFADFSTEIWVFVFLSGVCAIFINISQFTIVGDAGAVTGTVIGHVKTVLIVLIGWARTGDPVSQSSVLGASVAVVGIVTYTLIDARYRRASQG